MNGSDPKQIAREFLEEAHPALIGLSHWIHANPEPGYQEVLASGWVTEWLTTAGFDVRTGVAGMPTAVVGSYGPGPFHVAVCVEYDALPAVGHACGHNVIAAAGVGAGLALAAVADQLGLRVTVLGTPAEETGGGKIGMIKAGELDGVHAAMMVHPWPDDQATPPVIAIRSLNVAYTGTAAHAAGYPHLGVNAADALVVAQTAIALLRQQLRATDRVHGIVTKGGDAANIIPARTEAQWMVRGTSVARLDELTVLVRRCFEAGALATGATLEIHEEICYADVRHDPDLARLYQSNAEELGRVFSAPGMPLSTDMGNISYVVPTIHPMIGVEADGAVNHQADFAAACATPSADRAIFDGALAMAWTAIDAAQDADLRSRLMEFRPDPAEVAMVSSAWMMPAVAAAAVAAAPAPDVVEMIEVLEFEAEVDDDGLVAEALLVTEAIVKVEEEGADADLIAGIAPEQDPAWAAEPDAEADPVAEGTPDRDPAWAAAAWAAEPAWAADPVVDPVAEADPAMDADTAWAADVDAVAQQMVAVGLLQDPGGNLGTAEVADVDTADADAAVLDAAFLEAAEPVAEASADAVLFVGFEEAGAEPVTEVEVPATAEDTAVDTEQVLDVWVTPDVLGEWQETPAAPVAAVSVAELRDRDAWERAFEEAAVDPASELQDVADEREEVAVAAAWPPEDRELMSRERIEAEGFAFVAPEISSPLDELGDVWSRNGNGADHAGEDVRLR